ncbi:MAG TPA: type VI secretion system baseplate subunit TssE, partial [Caulobacteraceae bacterium]
DSRIVSIVDETGEGSGASKAQAPTFYTVASLERFNETALRATVRRELAWLLNTTNLGAAQDLSPYPEVQTSVLNYGMPDLTGRASTVKAIRERSEQIRKAILVYEPRMEADKLQVEARSTIEKDNAVTFLIRGDVTSAVKAMPVQFLADVEVETGEAVVRE